MDVSFIYLFLCGIGITIAGARRFEFGMTKQPLPQIVRRLFVADCAAALSQASAAELFLNGDFGSFGGAPANSANVPTGWFQTIAGLTVSQSALNSTFTNAYANNGSSFSLVDEVTEGTDGYRQVWPGSAESLIAVNFDFRLGSLTNNVWGIQFDNTVNSAVHFRIDTIVGSSNNQFAINNNGPLVGITTLEANKWYKVQAVFDDAAGTVNGSITPEGGAAITFPPTALLTGHAGFTSLLVRDRSTGLNGDLLVDNVSVSQVPEPAGFGLLGLGVAAAFSRRSRK